MKKELEAKIMDDHPLLYADRHLSSMITCMCWGFEGIGDGWYSLLYNLSSDLEKEISKFVSLYPNSQAPKAVQVKEKFGSLTVYLSSGNEKMFDLIDESRTQSMTICDQCGNLGKLRTDGWWKVLCDNCHKGVLEE